MSALSLRGLHKHYGQTRAIDGVDLDVDAGDLFFLLGPSGCGKTTLLRMLAGFVEPTEGRIAFFDTDVTFMPPNKRNTGMVFQSYALWPHMTVEENVGYGLAVRKVSATQARRRVEEVLAIVHMQALAGRKPNQLSGGQQQRVALARALVIEPTVLLLDEPLSNLDARLRLEMRTEIRRICKASGITTVYVTHDQKEALSIADKVALLQDGKVVQTGTPRELYTRPVNAFAAEFLGETNFLPATIVGWKGILAEIETPAGNLVSSSVTREAGIGSRWTCSIRPEAFRLKGRSNRNLLNGIWKETVFLGETAQQVLETGDTCRLRMLCLNPGPPPAAGDKAIVQVAPKDIVLLPPDDM